MSKHKLNRVQVELKDFKDFMALPWDKSPFAVLNGSKVELWTSKSDIMEFNVNDFHNVVGYGSLRWKSLFEWLTRYLDRSLSFQKSVKAKDVVEVLSRDSDNVWDNTKTNDLYYDLKDSRAFLPGDTIKPLGQKLYFTEISDGDSTSSRYERVWGTTFVHPMPEQSDEGKTVAKPFGSGDKYIDTDGSIRFVETNEKA